MPDASSSDADRHGADDRRDDDRARPASEPPSPVRPNPNLRTVLLLKGGAAVFGLLGLMITSWLLDKALRYPEIKASQFGNQAPLWIPAILFVVVSTVAGIYVLFRAARRVEAGEDLFGQRHRRHPDDPPPPEASDEAANDEAAKSTSQRPSATSSNGAPEDGQPANGVDR
jgi:hypothetical protein